MRAENSLAYLFKYHWPLMANTNSSYLTTFTSFGPANIYFFRVSNRNTRKRCEVCAKLTIKTLE